MRKIIIYSSQTMLVAFVKKILFIFTEEEEREKERDRNIDAREKHLPGCLLQAPKWGLGLKPRHVP